MIVRQLLANTVSECSATLEQFNTKFGEDNLSMGRAAGFFAMYHPVSHVIRQTLERADRVIKEVISNPMKMMMNPIEALLETAKAFPRFSPNIVSTRNAHIVLGQMSQLVKIVLPNSLFSQTTPDYE